MAESCSQEASSDSEGGGGGGWWDSWIKTAKEKSAEAYEFMKKDLSEFGSVVQNETSNAVAKTSQTLQGKLSEESKQNTAEPTAGQKLKEGFALFLGGISKALTIPPDSDDDDEAVSMTTHPELFDRAKARLRAVQIDPGTYCRSVATQDDEDYSSWLKEWNLEQDKATISELLVSNVQVRSLYTQLRYFYKVHQLEQDEQRKVELKNRADQTKQHQDLSWDDDWDDKDIPDSPRARSLSPPKNMTSDVTQSQSCDVTQSQSCDVTQSQFCDVTQSQSCEPKTITDNITINTCRDFRPTQNDDPANNVPSDEKLVLRMSEAEIIDTKTQESDVTEKQTAEQLGRCQVSRDEAMTSQNETEPEPEPITETHPNVMKDLSKLSADTLCLCDETNTKGKNISPPITNIKQVVKDVEVNQDSITKMDLEAKPQSKLGHSTGDEPLNKQVTIGDNVLSTIDTLTLSGQGEGQGSPLSSSSPCSPPVKGLIKKGHPSQGQVEVDEVTLCLIKGDIVLVGPGSGSDRMSDTPTSESSGNIKEVSSLGDDWEKDFDLELAEEDIKLESKTLSDAKVEGDDWEKWE